MPADWTAEDDREFGDGFPGQARSCSCSRRNTPLRPRLTKSDDALAVAIGLVVEPGEDLGAPVADAAADAEAARAGA
jgi:hypothetical protein